jgi:hypothetical protein
VRRWRERRRIRTGNREGAKKNRNRVEAEERSKVL